MAAAKQPVLNRKDRRMLVRHDAAGGQKLAIILHGFSGSMDERHIARFGAVFRARGFDTLMIDATNSFNEADGGIEEASWTSQLEDLEDTIAWASKQPWYRAPFALAGHSLGSAACLIYAERHPEKVSLLAPTSTVISGALRIEAYEKYEPEELAQLRNTGYRDLQCGYRPGIGGRRYWAPIEQDWSRYDVLRDARNLTMPVLLLVGAADTATPPDQQKTLLDVLQSERELHVIPDADHCFAPGGVEIAAGILDDWLRRQERTSG